MDHNLHMHKHLEAKAKNCGNNNTSKKKINPVTQLTRSKSCNIDESTPLFVSTDGRQSCNSMLSFSSSQQMLIPIESKNTIRFQVVVWYIGKIDMVQGRVPMTFRVTLFWNDRSDEALMTSGVDNNMETESVSSKRSAAVWQMQGRQRAFQQETKEAHSHAMAREVPVPAISILNVVSFDIVGSPEVSMLREDTKLMRWTCMYKATLVQEHWRVDSFPHDDHDITLTLAILSHRLPGQPWDRNIWDLTLATEQGSQGSTRISHGLVVDHMTIPEFMYDKEQGLMFDFVPLNHGPDSFQRALLTLNIAFAEIGIRMMTDSHLPNVSYQIKLQKILNEYFSGLLLLVLEGNLVYELHRGGSKHTIYVDACAAIIALGHNAYRIFYYYLEAHNAKAKLYSNSKDAKHDQWQYGK